MKGDFRVKRLSRAHGNCEWLAIGRVDGKRKRAFFATKEQADNFSRAQNIERKEHGRTLASFPTQLRAEALSAIELLKPTGASLSEAVRYFVAHHDHRAKSVTVTVGWQEYGAWCQKRVANGALRARSFESMRAKCTDLAEQFGEELICDLSSQRIWKWLENLPLAQSSKESYRNTVSGFFTYAVRSGWIKEHPMIGKVPKFEVEAKEVTVFSTAEAAALLAQASTEILPVIALGLFAGLRPEEISKLHWSDVLWEKREINIRIAVSKTARPRFVPMEANLLEWLAPYRQATGKVFHSALQAQIRAVTATAKLAFGEAYVWPKDVCRHSYGSNVYALTRSAPETAFRMGHSTTKMLFSNYNNRRSTEEARSYFGIYPQGRENVVALEAQAA